MKTEHITADYIIKQRAHLGYSQQQLAKKLNVSTKTVYNWEHEITHPNDESKEKIAIILDASLEKNKLSEQLSYSQAGVNIAYTDSIKKEIAKHMQSLDPRVLNGVGPFASLYNINYPELSEPVLVLKSEEPGSKQKIAMEYGYTESICHDMINHLVNDIIVMGAKPLAVLDTIVCGKAEKETISSLIKGISDACKNNECSLVGGETSVQPHVIDDDTYILSSTIAGIVDKSNIIDGTTIKENDIILGISSNGLHTNGYSLIRLLIEQNPEILHQKLDSHTFIEHIMKPHTPYYIAIKELLGNKSIHGMAHITGGGIEGNICRIIPDELCACIELNNIFPLPLFNFIRESGSISDSEMLTTFNCGIGFILIVSPESAAFVKKHIMNYYSCYQIGKIKKGISKVKLTGTIHWNNSVN